MRRRAPIDSSLELLLDTICNTFGGVLFLAILVCILLHNAGHSTSVQSSKPEYTEADVLDLVRRQQELEAVLEGLRAAASQQDQLAAQFTKRESQDLQDALAQAQNERAFLDDARLAALAEIAAKQAKAAAVEQELADLEQELAAARQQAAQSQAALESDIKSRSVTNALPRERGSSKREVGFVVRYGRLYQWLRYDRLGYSAGLNDEEFVVVAERSAQIETLPKPYAGTPIEDSSSQQIQSRFRQFSPDSSYLAIAMWDDSFDVFQDLKAAIVAAGFEYRLILMQEGSTLVDRGGTDAKVQ